MESFFCAQAVEWGYLMGYACYKEAETDLFDSNRFCHHHCHHSVLGDLIPLEFGRKFEQ